MTVKFRDPINESVCNRDPSLPPSSPTQKETTTICSETTQISMTFLSG